jgi:hypothetical protein
LPRAFRTSLQERLGSRAEPANYTETWTSRAFFSLASARTSSR